MTPFPTPTPLTCPWLLSLLSIALLGLGVRLLGLDAQSIWYDEAVTQQIILRPVIEQFRGQARDNGNPPFYCMAARSWQQIAGQGDSRLRAFSVLCGTAAITFLGLLGRRLTSPIVGLLAALVYAVSPLAIEFANEARTYALLQLLAVVNAWLFVRWVTDGGFWNCVGYSTTMFLCWYSHYYAAFLPVAHLLVLLTLPWSSRRWAIWSASIAVAGLLWASWLPVFFNQLGTAGNLTRSAETWKVQFLATPVTFAYGRTLAWRDSSVWLLGVTVVGTVLGFMIPALVGAMRIVRQKGTATLIFGWLLLPIAIPLVVAILFKPVYSHRYAAIGLPAFALLVGMGYATLRPGPRWVLASIAACLTVASLARYVGEPLKDDWRSAVPAIQARLEPETLMVFDTAIEIVSYQHYVGPEQPASAIGLDTSSADGPAFMGIRYRNGSRIDETTRDYAAEIFSAERVCLVLCVPKRSFKEYEVMFVNNGFALAQIADFHRIRILWFERSRVCVTQR